MTLFAHHAEAYFAVEINGRSFPDGMTEHAIVIGVGAVVLGFVAYGLYAALRDIRRWRLAPAVAGG